MIARTVAREMLDDLPPDDPRARRSRADLRRINRLMGNARVVADLLKDLPGGRVLEIGAGDGTFMLRVAKVSRPSRVTLLDQQPFSPPEGFARLGVPCETVAADAFTYLESPRAETYDAIVANLFLHHFERGRLNELLRRIAARTQRFVACEPRRSALALAGTRALGLIGCNDVTRHDARVSVLAGFQDGELSALWPEAGWTLTERSAPPFGHAFRAVRSR